MTNTHILKEHCPTCNDDRFWQMTLDKHRNVKFCTNCLTSYPDHKLHKKDNIIGDISFFLGMRLFQPFNNETFEQLKDFILFSQDDNKCKYPGFKY